MAMTPWLRMVTFFPVYYENSRWCEDFVQCTLYDYLTILSYRHLSSLSSFIVLSLNWKPISSACWSLVFFSLYQPITISTCICSVCVCVCVCVFGSFCTLLSHLLQWTVPVWTRPTAVMLQIIHVYFTTVPSLMEQLILVRAVQLYTFVVFHNVFV